MHDVAAGQDTASRPVRGPDDDQVLEMALLGSGRITAVERIPSMSRAAKGASWRWATLDPTRTEPTTTHVFTPAQLTPPMSTSCDDVATPAGNVRVVGGEDDANDAGAVTIDVADHDSSTAVKIAP